MSSRSLLLPIVAHARAGAVDHAWRLFREAGLEGSDDPAVLSLMGRLLKDRGRAAAEDRTRRDLYLAAADAYGRAARAGGGAYPRINAATLSLLGGGEAEARRLAQAVLEAPEEEHETPYYQAATRAEALLVLGRVDEARAALAEAVARAPEAWEDHAVTLRQFALLLEALGAPAGWLEGLRPPRALHYGGHLGVAPDGGELVGQVERLLEAERVGFGYGALAAGADILIAEALVRRGARLHVVLSATPDAFLQACVAPLGADWAERYGRLLEAAESVHAVAAATSPAGPLALRLAEETALGQAVMKARALSTEAIQLLVSGSTPAQDAWAAAGGRQLRLGAPRTAAPPVPPPPEPDLRLVALLAVRFPAVGQEVLQALPAVPMGWVGQTLQLVHGTPQEAAATARALMAMAPGSRVAGHYGLVHATALPGSGHPAMLGAEADIAPALLASVPPGAVHFTEVLAAALHSASGDWRTDHVGDLPHAPELLEVHALRL